MIAKTYNRRFRGMPVREAVGILRVQPLQEDIENAVPEDPERCAYSLCLRRLLHTNSVYIYKSIAYVQTLDEGGNKIFERYRIKGAARKYIDDFDAGKGIGPGSFSLYPPSPAETLDAKNEHDAMRRGKKQKIRGTATKKRISPPREHGIGFLRSGTGCVRFIGAGNWMSTKATAA